MPFIRGIILTGDIDTIPENFLHYYGKDKTLYVKSLLRSVIVTNADKLTKIPDDFGNTSLEYVEISNCPNLKEIDKHFLVNPAFYSDSTLTTFDPEKSLQSRKAMVESNTLSQNKLTIILYNLPNLKNIGMSFAQNSPLNNLIITNTPKLASLSLNFCTSCKNLIELDLRNASNLKTLGFQFTHYNKNLQNIFLPDNLEQIPITIFFENCFSPSTILHVKENSKTHQTINNAYTKVLDRKDHTGVNLNKNQIKYYEDREEEKSAKE